ncbi:MAG TPA: hypothetical protein VF727_03090 [Allosphingosinicella sp.]
MAEQATIDHGRNFTRGSCLAFGLMGLALFVLLPVFLLGSCISRDEVARLPSPDGALEAVLVEINGGATTDFAYAVRLEEPGWFGAASEVASFYAAHRSDCAYGVNLRWAGPDRLLIEYRDAEQAEARPARIGGRNVSVQLKPGVTDPTAPCGGMHHNLRGRRQG